jgi:hypothetical protein
VPEAAELAETKGQGVSEPEWYAFLGKLVAKMLKVNDARLRKAAAMKRARIVSGEPDELRSTRYGRA